MTLALKFNSNTVFARGKDKHLTDLLKSKNFSIKNFYLSKSHKIAWKSKEKFSFAKIIWAKIILLTSMAASRTAFCYETLIKHFIPADYDHTVLGGACLTGLW